VLKATFNSYENRQSLAPSKPLNRSTKHSVQLITSGKVGEI